MKVELKVDTAAFERDIRARIALESRERARIAFEVAAMLLSDLVEGTPVDTGATADAWRVSNVEHERYPGETRIKTQNKARGAIWGIYAGQTVRAHSRRTSSGSVPVRSYRRVNYGAPSQRRRFVLAAQTDAAKQAYEMMRHTGVFDAP